MKYLKLFENFDTPLSAEDEILKGYLETALWTAEYDDSNIDDYDKSSIDDARKDIKKFLEMCILRGYIEELTSNMDKSTIGHNFWLTRNGHGAGFWDSNLDEELGKSLSTISEDIGGSDIYKGDDEKIYFM